jgi:3',5'-cyclic AMP phosphodiesterase CpdA
MRTIIHVSDIHFGKFDTTCLGPMVAVFRGIKPDVVVISGDLTQRARIQEYEQAKAFINRLEWPYFVVPGNHDIRPFSTLFKRLFKPFDRYDKYISPVHEPVYANNDIAIAGIDTVRPTAIKDGRVNLSQIERASNWFNKIKRKHPNALRIIVTHHPLNLPTDLPRKKLVGRAKMAIHKLSEAGVDIYLSGHYHQSGVGHTVERHKIEDYSALFVQAGTVSVRQRGEVQSFNVIRTNGSEITVQTYLWNPKIKTFEVKAAKHFSGQRRGWKESKEVYNSLVQTHL